MINILTQNITHYINQATKTFIEKNNNKIELDWSDNFQHIGLTVLQKQKSRSEEKTISKLQKGQFD